MAFTVSCQKSRLFFTVNRQKVRVIQALGNINRQNVSGYFKSLYFDEILAPEEYFHLKNHGPCCQKHPHSLFLSL